MLILMGGPGVGKGTLADNLCAYHAFEYIEMGQILRDVAKHNDTVADILARGDFLPDNVVCDILNATVNTSADVLLDGFPRTLSQAKWLVVQYTKIFDIHVLFIDATRDIITARIHKRHATGLGRSDDTNIDVINHRIDNFNTTTMPAVEYLRDAPGIKFHTIDGHGTTQQNLAEAIDALKK